MSDDKELYHFFKSEKNNIPDNGFSQKVMSKLPRRINVLSYLIIVICVVSGSILTVGVAGIDPFIDQINSLALSLSQMQIPSLSSVIAYIIGLMSLGTVSFAIYKVDGGLL